MNRRNRASIAANPVLVGAVTTLVVVIAVFLAYNANNGLPFVPTTQLKFQVGSGANLLPGNEVREGGERIGVVEDMIPVRLPDGTTGAEVHLKLDKKHGKVPVDSTFRLRPRSVLGLKYVQLTRGTSSDTYADGDIVAPDQASYATELEEFFRLYDKRTREGVRRNLRGFGNAFAERGGAINETIADLPRLLRHLEPVARNLADEETQLGRFFSELGDAARIISPVADRYAHSFEAGADTFEAWSRHPEQLGRAIETQSDTLDAGIRSFAVQRPFLRDFRDLNIALRRATDTLPRTLPRIVPALQVGSRVQLRTPELNRPLRTTLVALRELMEDPATGVALRGLGRTTAILNPLLRYIGPHITVCNYFNYAVTHLGEHLTEPDPTGFSQRSLLNQASRPTDPRSPSMGSIGAQMPSNGEPVLSGSPMNFHSSAYGAAIDDAGNADCESGQRGYMRRLAPYAPATSDVVTHPHTPGNQGPTYTGRPRVPQGQTFDRNPNMGTLMPEDLR